MGRAGRVFPLAPETVAEVIHTVIHTMCTTLSDVGWGELKVRLGAVGWGSWPLDDANSATCEDTRWGWHCFLDRIWGRVR